MSTDQNKSQIKFNQTYITSTEVAKFLGISRAGLLYGRLHGKLADPIEANDGRLVLWERTPELMAELTNWKANIDARKFA